MAVKFNAVKCPECGANLPIEEGRDRIFCSYCGTQILMTNENEQTIRHVDEASIRKTEAEEMLRLKELELEEKENERSRKGRIAAYAVSLIILAAGLVMSSTGSGSGAQAILFAMIIAGFTFIVGDDKKKKARRTSFSDEVQITKNMQNYSGKDYIKVASLFQASGFTNVSANSLRDLSFFSSKKDGQVESVSINGNDDFEAGDIFSKTDHVVITYHSMR